ncbi:MAG: hypothetical protein NZ954_00390 [Thermofilaceae archaeon]|nr:hypothetical protein [Thermofilaceae archaeon]MCX8180362.1 hypothetical protein [Thermofilaceae archaeon]MDW8003897.1 hypothetical protein [Thermofilaceae archaeon]
MKHKGGVPPIVTVLIVIAAIVGSALVAYFMYATTSAASRTPVLEISPLYVTGGSQSGASVSCSATATCRLTLMVKNTGTTTVTIDRVYVYRGDFLVVNATFSTPVVIQPGQSFSHPSPGVSFGTFNEGDPLTVEVRLTGSGGTILLTTRVSLP